VTDELEVAWAKAWSRVERWEASGLACKAPLEAEDEALESRTGEPVTSSMMAFPKLAICCDTLGLPASASFKVSAGTMGQGQGSKRSWSFWGFNDFLGKLVGTEPTAVCLISRS
jgi:hypothetical protein